MNLLLLEPEDIVAPGRAIVKGRRLTHVQDVHKAEIGHTLRVGELNGLMGEAIITRLQKDVLELDFTLDTEPPSSLPVTVLLALPRPKMLKRTLQTLAAMGVKKIVLMNTYRVEKSFWQSPWLKPEAVREQLILGLEQARDTVLPEVILEKRFKPFVEDRLPEMSQGMRKLVAHPKTDELCPSDINVPTVLAIGPEGGFIPYEVERLVEYGFECVHLGPRILRVETAVPVLLSRLFH
ncbi:16S rRNA (uracil(1498)-N(3))-methyltransferase [Sansalvadorimonas sp. 2012CJ34-2]|uniref:Ribosomal RNA small subunit methyltransferase E n=1 Tax=Parendozoicomonas callyspongiae TaxID=2942213 RepID=A0ABT0PGW4_9GAMM|nr:16S rRNA (uracil(1498)-N(3))-methyltransferase [Sansalvadorimonas sp. 2012CJ34-2]MCL6270599.1 16S rRNA (uracil(1498)-N(3))-methyltransferase [Sansalvadorimonas sp. 2012CJ34-2]